MSFLPFQKEKLIFKQFKFGVNNLININNVAVFNTPTSPRASKWQHGTRGPRIGPRVARPPAPRAPAPAPRTLTARCSRCFSSPRSRICEKHYGVPWLWRAKAPTKGHLCKIRPAEMLQEKAKINLWESRTPRVLCSPQMTHLWRTCHGSPSCGLRTVSVLCSQNPKGSGSRGHPHHPLTV